MPEPKPEPEPELEPEPEHEPEPETKIWQQRDPTPASWLSSGLTLEPVPVVVAATVAATRHSLSSVLEGRGTRQPLASRLQRRDLPAPGDEACVETVATAEDARRRHSLDGGSSMAVELDSGGWWSPACAGTLTVSQFVEFLFTDVH